MISSGYSGLAKVIKCNKNKCVYPDAKLSDEELASAVKDVKLHTLNPIKLIESY